MNYKIATLLGIAALMVPVGIVLAKDGGQGSVGIGIGEHAQVGLNQSLLHGDANEDSTTSANVDVEEHGNATSTQRDHGKQGNLERGIHATTTASTTDDHNKGFGKGGIVGFFRWILGLPDTTTVGQIRAQIEATTTASTSASSSQGLGFWAQILGFLHLR